MIEIRNTKKYELIADRIEEMIIESGMKEGDRLASVSELTRLFNVAPATTCNALDLLRRRRKIVSVPRKGNFIGKIPSRKQEPKSDFASYLEACNPFGAVFSRRSRTISVCMDEYRFSFRKQMWDEIFSLFHRDSEGVEIKVIEDKSQAGNTDIVLTSNHMLNDSVLRSPDLRRKLFGDFSKEGLYPAALNALSGNDYAVMPFAISQQMRLLNCGLVQRHCPGLLARTPANFISHIIGNYDFKSQKFPPLATFIHFLPLTLTEEGIDIYDARTGRIDFSDGRIPGILEFNRCMVAKLQFLYDGWTELSLGRLWENFLEGRLMAVDTFSYAMPMVAGGRNFKISAQASSMRRLNSSITRIQMLGITKNCRNVEGAAEFIRFACGVEGQSILAKSGCNIPVLRSCAESDAFLGRCPDNMRSNLKELEYGKSLLDIPIYDVSKFSRINYIAEDYYFGRITLDKALDSLKSMSVK